MTSPVNPTTNYIRNLLVAVGMAVVWFLNLPAAIAQTLDEVEVLTEKADVVVRIKFNFRVQYLRHAPTGSGDLMQIFFRTVSVDEVPSGPPVEETRSAPPSDLVPRFTVTYPLQSDPQNKQISVRFASKVTYRVRPGPGNRSIDIIIPGAAKAAVGKKPAPVVAAKPSLMEEGRYAVNLQALPASETSKIKPIPAEFQDLATFSSQSVRDGVTQFEVNLGYFATEADAEKVRKAAAKTFPDAKVIDLVKRKEETLLSAAATAGAKPVPPGAPAPQPKAPVGEPVQPGIAVPLPPPGAAPSGVPESETDKRAGELMTRGRDALVAENNELAINTLDQLLILPPNVYTQEAQELVGLARERAGEIPKAKTEYELYLKLFPEGEGAQRVRQRLANLETQQTAAAPLKGPQPPPGAAKTLTGSLSQYYYGGKTKIDTTFLNVPGGADKATLSATTQSALVTNLDVGGRYRSEESDTRLVVRDTNSQNFLSTGHNDNRLNAAYVDYKSLLNNYSFRLGRQSAVSGGILGLFDGGIFGYGFAPKWRINAVAGVPADTLTNAKQRFAGVNLEVENLADRWGGNIFFINQTVDSVLDRRAVGGEIRYFDANRSLYSLVDYDTSYRVLNAATIQGTWQSENQTTVSLLLDQRKVPPLQTSNALIGASVSSIKTLLETFTLDEIRDQARAITATSKQALLGVTKPINQTWQLGADARYTSVGPLPAVRDLPAQPGTGNAYNYDLQATGTNLYSQHDISVFSFTYLTSAQFKGKQFSYNNLTGFLDNKVTFEPSIRWYSQTDNLGLKLTRITPGMRFTYRFTQRMAVEADALLERSRSSGPLQNEVTNDRFYYLGYRYDLQ